MAGERAQDRKVLEVTGEDRMHFLQGLVTNDVTRLSKGILYAALLSPQGKYLADFFLIGRGDSILIDVKADLAEALLRHLSVYRLRSKVAIRPVDLAVTRGLGEPPVGALPDPRHPSLGWRAYGEMSGSAPSIDWDVLRVAACIPETGIELLPDDSYIVEAGFERLHGVDFRKGCYVGQEVTARMKHKTEVRKGLAQVTVSEKVPVGTAIEADGKPAGVLYTQAGGLGIAFLRFERATGAMHAGPASVRLVRPDHGGDG
jgi:tRNA-modifying protein YgfZ